PTKPAPRRWPANRGTVRVAPARVTAAAAAARTWVAPDETRSCGCPLKGAAVLDLATQLCQCGGLLVAVEQIEGVERNDPSVRLRDVHAGLLHRAQVEAVGVDELHDQHSEHVAVAEI